MRTIASVISLLALVLLAGCGSSKKTESPTNNPPNGAVRNYNGTASVGDFLTISIDPDAMTITYNNHTNGESGTVPYTVNSDGSYAVADSAGNLLSAYEVPGSVMVIEAAHAGPNRDLAALITAIESVPVTAQTLAGHNFIYTQFRTNNGGVEIGAGNLDASGNMTVSSYDPGQIMWQGSSPFGGGTVSSDGISEDPSGNSFTITNQEKGEVLTVFGTQNGLFAIDGQNGAVIGLPQASGKDFDPAVAGTYNAIYYQKTDAQMQNNIELGTPAEGKASVTVTAAGAVTITDGQNNLLGSGTLVAVADASYLYDGTPQELSNPCYGLFTFETTSASLRQETFVTFISGSVVFSSFETSLPIQNNGAYTYFYGVGLK